MQKSFNRPISPHFTIYLPQNSSLFSIWHRISGVVLITFLWFSTYLLQFNVWWVSFMFFNLSNYINFILFFLLIFVIILNLLYHLLNGIRHIVWDFNLLINKYDLLINVVWITLIILQIITLNKIFF
jgi:succinate dehydrogenase / fumarate reductase cytochrome b subunit|uniref:Succinate:cytochrome c oxidoreductase subunit 3 n=1 Tax=Kumanoa mahlacensis TaxID=1196387 RepID=A0A343UXX5_9FLOR|nr:succinate:cytochrome c oxidoreductase subunit 3 [Kumanoa mahlacensis]AVK39532.1 succinate:cytochrome c oxidoreductase subunit 3 [Kumanoa mahlacensis]UEQ11855.1 succinate:cytochrome c oxidoreductase subunit 3 [Kumanoa mahlacensis]